MSAQLADWLPSLPSGWSMKPFYCVFTERKQPNVGLAVDNVLSLSYGRIVERDVESNHGLLPASFEGYNIVEPRDIVMRLTDLQNDQRSLRTGQVEERGVITSAYVTVTPAAEIHPRFAHYLLHGYDLAKLFYRMGGGLRQSMKFDDLKRMPVVLPPPADQERIANFLDEQTARIDALIAEKERLLSKLDELRWARVANELLNQPHTEAKPQRLKYLVESCQNGLWGDEPTEDAPNVVVVRVADFDKKNRRVSLENPTFRHIEQDKLRHRLLKRGDLLIEKSGGGPTSPVGNVVMFDADVPAICSNFVARMPVVEGNDPAFVGLMFQALYALGRNVPHIKQTSGIQNLDADSYLSQTVPVPPLDRQRLLAQRVLADFASMESLEATSAAAVERLREYRSSLISAAVTGQLDLSTFKAVA